MSSYYDDPDFADEYRRRDEEAEAFYAEEKEREKMAVMFHHHGSNYKADGVGAVVQRDEITVEVRYNDGSSPLVLHNTTSSEVLAAIERAKADADSA